MKEEDFGKKLTREQYHILRERGTEAPGTGKILYNKKTGMYKCAACGNLLFSSKHKFESGTGWPSFYEANRKGSVTIKKDSSLGMERTEVLCARCGSHLGHLFEEQKTKGCPTGKRFCINSLALGFEEKKFKAKKKKSKNNLKSTIKDVVSEIKDNLIGSLGYLGH